jgi:hypothetical protein
MFAQLQVSVVDPHHLDADPDPDFYLMRMRIQVVKMMRISMRIRIRIHNTATSICVTVSHHELPNLNCHIQNLIYLMIELRYLVPTEFPENYNFILFFS